MNLKKWFGIFTKTAKVLAYTSLVLTVVIKLKTLISSSSIGDSDEDEANTEKPTNTEKTAKSPTGNPAATEAG